MKIDMIIKALRARCPSFAGRVGGFGEYARIIDDGALKLPCAYVVSLADTAGENEQKNGYRQTIRDRFGVLAALPNQDPRGQHNANLADDLRDELNRALLGWRVDGDYYGIVYDGNQLYEMNRAASWYSYEYYADFMIDSSGLADPETWHQKELDELPEIDSLKITIDAIDPHDPNQGVHGPDGVAEGTIEIHYEEDEIRQAR